MMLDDAKLQTSFLKDLVTAADPTSAYSFLAYLVAHRRFYRFINAEFSHVQRREFADYLKWVAGKLPNLQLNHEVREVQFGENGFTLRFDQGEARARHLVVATGTTPRIPEWARPHDHRNVCTPTGIWHGCQAWMASGWSWSAAARVAPKWFWT